MKDDKAKELVKKAKAAAKKAPVKQVKKPAKKKADVTEKPKMGRPTTYTDKIADDICDLIADGNSVLAISKMDGMPPHRTIRHWLIKYDYFLHKYREATKIRAEFIHDEMYEIAKDCPIDSAAVARARLMIDTRKWSLGRLNPTIYGDKVQAEVTHNISDEMSALMDETHDDD